MAVKGPKKEETQFTERSKKIGIGNFEIVAVNPASNEDIAALGFPVFDENKEPEYVGTKDVEIKNAAGEVIDTIDNVKTARIDFYLKELKVNGTEGHKQRISFYLDNYSKKTKSGNTCYINEQGNHQYVKDEDDLWDSFKAYDYREAKVGETDLYEFLRKAYNMKWSEGATVSYNIKDFFKGKFKELQDDVAEIAGPIMIPITVVHKESEDAEGNKQYKEYQSFFKAYAPGTADNVKKLNLQQEWKEADAKAIRRKIDGNVGKKGKDRTFVNDLERMVDALENGEYSCKDSYFLGPLKDYNPEEDFVSTDDTAIAPSDSHFR